MEDDRRGANLTAAVANLSHNFDRLLNIKGGVDSISSLPDEILHQILSFIPTKLAITTSVLSKRWRHVWSETPCLNFRRYKLSGDSISKTLASYTAAKITSFHVHTTVASKRDHHVDTLIEFAMTHNAELFSLELGYNSYSAYSVPDSFFRCSSLKQLIVCSRTSLMIPRCIVSWTSLRNLSLTYCKLSDASFSKMLSGSPMLETLTLNSINSLEYLDLSNSMRLKRLDIDLLPWVQEPMQIVAPHIHSLRLRTLKFVNDQAQSNCTLVDVSSLTEANIDFLKFLPEIWCNATGTLKAAIHDMVQTMLEKLLNVEKLTLGVSLLQMLSIAEAYGVPLPTFNVKTLTLETRILRSVAPGIARLLQNSPELKKITIYAIDCFTEVDKCVNGYLDKQDLNPDQCSRLKDVVSLASWEREVAEPKLVASFVELLLANTRRLETLVLRLGSFFDRSRFGELSQITHTLPHNSNVSIVIK